MSFLSRRSRKLWPGILIFCLMTALSPAYGEEAFFQKGAASWYGILHHGKATATGERFDMYAMTVAHRSIPLGTLVKVRHMGNGKSAVVRINDRGPYLGNRVVDLSFAAAECLGITGVSEVSVEVVGDREGRPLDRTQSFFVLLKDGPISSSSVERQIGRLVYLGVRDAASRLYIKNGAMAMGPYASFEESQEALARVATTHPGARIMLEASSSMFPASLFLARS